MKTHLTQMWGTREGFLETRSLSRLTVRSLGKGTGQGKRSVPAEGRGGLESSE